VSAPACVFFGTPAFAVESLRAVSRVARVALVVSQPDRPAGRGRRLCPTPVKEAAQGMGIEVIQPASLKDPALRSRLGASGAAFFFVTAYGRILPRAILDLPPLGCVNLHASLLPRHRGAAPVPWAILSGDEESGLTLMKMDRGMDTGPIIALERMRILDDETAGGLAGRLAEASGGFIVENLPRYLDGGLVPVAQDDARATAAPPLAKRDGIVDWSRSAAEVARQVRAVTPWPGARTCMSGRMVCIRAVRPPAPGDGEPAHGPPGTLFCEGGRMRVRCGSGWIEILEIQAPGRRCLEAAEFLRGCRMDPCTRLDDGPGGGLA
jgi:methionyl-tRNA formyltransferase